MLIQVELQIPNHIYYSILASMKMGGNQYKSIDAWVSALIAYYFVEAEENEN